MTKIWLWALCLCCAFVPMAFADGLYDVDVLVDVVDKNAAQAREKALVAANRQGLINLLKKITTNDGLHQVAELNDNQILNFVKEVSIVSEKVSDVRYVAELKVRFNGSIIRKYLREKNIPFTEEGGFKVLILPLLQSGDKILLNETENTWREAWVKSADSDGIVDFIVAGGNTESPEVINAGKVLEFDSLLLEQLSQTYKADELYIVYAVPNSSGVQVKLFAPSGKGGVEQTLTIDGDGSQKNLETAVTKVKEVVSERIKKYNLEEDNKQYEMLVLYQYPSLKDWLMLQKDLRSAPYVKSVKEDAIGAGRVQFEIKYAGNFNRLEQVLYSRGLSLMPYDGFYVISKVRK